MDDFALALMDSRKRVSGMNRIHEYLLSNELLIATNPCISPDFCLNWPKLQASIASGEVTRYEQSRFKTAQGSWQLVEAANGDCAWILEPDGADAAPLQAGVAAGGQTLAYPASYENLLILKNLIQEFDAGSTIFPTAGAKLGRSTLGVGARFTTLHWPAVEWTMAALGMGLTANQNSIPRELVYDVDAMLDDRLAEVPFPFIGTSVPEGHQGQSVQGMAHGCVLSKLKSGFHQRRIEWSFNADHQPVGGDYDVREDALVDGCLLASYITFDLSPELAKTVVPQDPQAWVAAHVPSATIQSVQERVAASGLSLNPAEFAELLARVWPAMLKMKRRDEKYAAARESAFSTPVGRAYLRELSIDELPGLTTQATTAAMLALCEVLGMRIHFIAPALGFQKNLPYPDNDKLRALVDAQWQVCRAFNVGIGFHSGSGKSAENYRVLGEVTGACLEIKTSGRYTYEMGRALAASTDPYDQSLWADWYAFTRELALTCAFSEQATERDMARMFIADALRLENQPVDVFATQASARSAMLALTPSPEHPFWFEYNFLYVLAADGRATKDALGDHSPAGYRQRARFYAIRPAARLLYAKNVAQYLIFLAETTGIATADVCAVAKQRLAGLSSLEALIEDCAP